MAKIIPPIPSEPVSGMSKLVGEKSELDLLISLNFSFENILPKLSFNFTPLYKLKDTKIKKETANIVVEIIEF